MTFSWQIVGPILLNGVLVTDRWIGAASDPHLETAEDVRNALVLIVSIGLVVAAAASVLLRRWN